MNKFKEFNGYGNLDNRKDPGGDGELEATGGEALLVGQALLRQTSKKNSLLASQGSVRSSTSGKKIIPENLCSNLVLSYENCGLPTALPLNGNKGYQGSGHKYLEEGGLEGHGGKEGQIYSSGE